MVVHVNQGQSFLLAFKAFQGRTYLGFTRKPRIPRLGLLEL